MYGFSGAILNLAKLARSTCIRAAEKFPLSVFSLTNNIQSRSYHKITFFGLNTNIAWIMFSNVFFFYIQTTADLIYIVKLMVTRRKVIQASSRLQIIHVIGVCLASQSTSQKHKNKPTNLCTAHKFIKKILCHI